ncbi:MAG: hypothetical protein KJZ83_10685 [Burkholderiaceae bacterium]|nr:hypothetical protein [Burkholderiaceae bacterium]
MGSPTHPVEGDRDCYHGWTTTCQWEHLYRYDLLYAGPLFVHKFSHAWIDFRGIRDRFMREKRCDYFENSRRATEVQREHARSNPARVRRFQRKLLGPDRLRWPEPSSAGVGPDGSLPPGALCIATMNAGTMPATTM